MVDDQKSKFIDLFALFYEKFFASSAEAIEILADLQRKHKEDYDSIKEFNRDPNAIEKLMDELTPEKQAILLKILLKAGKFSKDMVNLFESNEEDKRKLAEGLRKFSRELSTEIKKESKNG